jgi:iron complex transport system substrate-binding protein
MRQLQQRGKVWVLVFLLITGLLGSNGILNGEKNDETDGENEKRVVSVAPALTEMVFALGQGHRLVGNTKFCNYPEAAKKVPRIGGFVDVNLELLIKKAPNLIFIYPENYEKIKIMEQKATLVQVSHTTLEDILSSIQVVANALEVPQKGKELMSGIQAQLNQFRSNAKGKKRLKTLLIIGRNPDKLTNMYIIGKKDFLSQLMEIAGGVNAYQGEINYPSISVESVVAMNPDVIIELSAFHEGIDKARVLKMWQDYPFISAVKNNKISIIQDSVWLIPGPRVPEIAKKMQEIYRYQ